MIQIKLYKYQKKYDSLLNKMYGKGNDSYQNVLVFSLMLSSLILDSNKKVITWISARISFENIKAFDTNLEPTMWNLASGRVMSKFTNSVLVQKEFFFIE